MYAFLLCRGTFLSPANNVIMDTNPQEFNQERNEIEESTAGKQDKRRQNAFFLENLKYVRDEYFKCLPFCDFGTQFQRVC